VACVLPAGAGAPVVTAEPLHAALSAEGESSMVLAAGASWVRSRPRGAHMPPAETRRRKKLPSGCLPTH